MLNHITKFRQLDTRLDGGGGGERGGYPGRGQRAREEPGQEREGERADEER